MGRPGASGGAALAVLGSIGTVLVAILLGVVAGLAGTTRGPIEGLDGTATARAYGDDPALDALWDACEDGDLGACDLLFWDSIVGSDYEHFGATCGERAELSNGSCWAALGPGGPDMPTDYGDDPVLDALWDACDAGDLTRCDDLYWSTPIDSAYERFGATCGGRTTFGVGDCRSRAS